MIAKKDRSVRGSSRWVYVFVALLATPVAATFVRRPPQGVAKAAVALQPVESVGATKGLSNVGTAVSEDNPNEGGDFAWVTENQEDGVMFEETSYAVVCCNTSDGGACTYYIGANKCPQGTIQQSCPCRQTHD